MSVIFGLSKPQYLISNEYLKKFLPNVFDVKNISLLPQTVEVSCELISVDNQDKINLHSKVEFKVNANDENKLLKSLREFSFVDNAVSQTSFVVNLISECQVDIASRMRRSEILQCSHVFEQAVRNKGTELLREKCIDLISYRIIVASGYSTIHGLVHLSDSNASNGHDISNCVGDNDIGNNAGDDNDIGNNAGDETKDVNDNYCNDEKNGKLHFISELRISCNEKVEGVTNVNGVSSKEKISSSNGNATFWSEITLPCKHFPYREVVIKAGKMEDMENETITQADLDLSENNNSLTRQGLSFMFLKADGKTEEISLLPPADSSPNRSVLKNTQPKKERPWVKLNKLSYDRLRVQGGNTNALINHHEKDVGDSLMARKKRIMSMPSLFQIALIYLQIVQEI